MTARNIGVKKTNKHWSDSKRQYLELFQFNIGSAFGKF